MMRDLAATVTCSEPGCTTTANVLLAHVPNVLAAGGWWCHDHDNNHSKETPRCPSK